MKVEEKLKEKYLYNNKLNIFKLLYFLGQFFKNKFKPRKPNSHWGVDLILNDIFKNKKKGFYIDVGCHHPIINNHTYLLHKKGWKGINIDLDFNSIDMFNFFRSNDLNKQVALTDYDGETELFFYHNRAAKNTISKKFGYDAKLIKKIKTTTLDKIINDANLSEIEIDFLSIDVEGNELNVLKGFNLKKFKPKIILLEYIEHNIKEFYQKDINTIIRSEIYLYMVANNYKLINWNHDDLMFMHKSF
tara:strand:- start:1786 stop:2523 length:738 start_codon:yes stop_codon:yes gene_type:complete